MSIRTHKIAAIPGDGIGVEVVAAGLEVLEALAERDDRFRLEVKHFDRNTDRYKKTGAFLPADGTTQLRDFNAILFRAVGAPDVPDNLTLWGLRLSICQALVQYANVRPTRVLPGIRSPLRQVAILRPCSSQSMGPPSTSLARAWPIRSRPFGSPR